MEDLGHSFHCEILDQHPFSQEYRLLIPIARIPAEDIEVRAIGIHL
jgi:hypothetical protein